MFLPCYFAFLAGCRRVTWKAKSTPMTRHSYLERDYAFGQTMFKLRTSLGLTQAGLADLHSPTGGSEALLFWKLWEAKCEQCLF
jgi:hypothetical protein